MDDGSVGGTENCLTGVSSITPVPEVKRVILPGNDEVASADEVKPDQSSSEITVVTESGESDDHEQGSPPQNPSVIPKNPPDPAVESYKLTLDSLKEGLDENSSDQQQHSPSHTNNDLQHQLQHQEQADISTTEDDNATGIICNNSNKIAASITTTHENNDDDDDDDDPGKPSDSRIPTPTTSSSSSSGNPEPHDDADGMLMMNDHSSGGQKEIVDEIIVRNEKHAAAGVDDSAESVNNLENDCSQSITTDNLPIVIDPTTADTTAGNNNGNADDNENISAPSTSTSTPPVLSSSSSADPSSSDAATNKTFGAFPPATSSSCGMSVCSSSLGSLSASLQSFDNHTDSAIGDSVSSKRSSLDRKSGSSVLSSECATTPGESEAAITSPTSSASSKIQTLSLPKGLFSRKWSPSLEAVVPSPLTSLFANNKSSSSTNNSPNPASGTTALILQDRPSGLPTKTPEEAAKHERLYQEMIEAAKRKEARQAKLRKKAEEAQKKNEEVLSNNAKLWTNTYLPKWDEMRQNKRCRELWWQGLPPSIRGKVWKLAIGNDLNLTSDLYEICAARAQEKLAEQSKQCDSSNSGGGGDAQTTTSIGHTRSPSFHSRIDSNILVVNRESTVELVQLDVSRTFPSLGIFQKFGPYYDLLLNLLGAYVCYRPDVGYVQGMSFIAGVLLLNMEPADAFIAFANILNRPLQLSLFRLKESEMHLYFTSFDGYLRQEAPKLHSHFATMAIRHDLYLIEWLYTLYAKTLPLDITCRIWDVYLRDGQSFLFKTAIGILCLHEEYLLECDFDGVVSFLCSLPSDAFSQDELFKAIETHFYRNRKDSHSNDKKSFEQIFQEHQQSNNNGGGDDISIKSNTSNHSNSINAAANNHSNSNNTTNNIGKSISGRLTDWLS